jgi:predicted nucleotide-binding protein
MADPGATLIDSAYRIKLRELQRAESDAESTVLGSMRASRAPGRDLAVLKERGGQLIDGVLNRCEVAIPELVKVHIDAGERESERIIASIWGRFVNVCLDHLPGASLYASLRGGLNASAEGAKLRQAEHAAFTARRRTLERTVKDHVFYALAHLDRPAKPNRAGNLPRAEHRTEHEPQSELIFIGHGHSGAWRELKDYLAVALGLLWDEFNREPVAGLSTKERLEHMLDRASFAFLVMTGDDSSGDGGRVARANVIHEVGLFQGRLGFERAIILLEEGCREFSNIFGISQIRFPRNNISACFGDVRRVLEREGQLSRSS